MHRCLSPHPNMSGCLVSAPIVNHARPLVSRRGIRMRRKITGPRQRHLRGAPTQHCSDGEGGLMMQLESPDRARVNPFGLFGLQAQVSQTHADRGDSLRGSSVNIGTMQRILAWPLRKDDTHKSRSVNSSSTCRQGTAPRTSLRCARDPVFGSSQRGV